MKIIIAILAMLLLAVPLYAGDNDINPGTNYVFDPQDGTSATYSPQYSWSYQFESGNTYNADGTWSYKIGGQAGVVTIREEPRGGGDYD